MALTPGRLKDMLDWIKPAENEEDDTPWQNEQ